MMRADERSGGFTLIELLVVIGILTVLAAAFLPGLIGANVEGERAATEARMEFLAQAAKTYQRRVGHYPADDFTDFSGKVRGKDNGLNPGIESLVLFLGQKRLGDDNLADHADWLVNLDGDEGTEVIPLMETKKLLEVADAWGMPIVYFCKANGGLTRVQRVSTPEGDSVRVPAATDPSSGKPIGREFQLLSAGPDQEFGTEDDLVYPRPGGF